LSDIVLVATILAFFLLAALLVRACAGITTGSLDDPELIEESETSEHSYGPGTSR